MSDLPLNNVINVTITNTPSGLSVRNVNSVAILSTETPNNLDPYGIYISPAQVIADYGTNSVMAQMANAIFAQSPNIRTGNGRLVIIPMNANATSATSGTMTTADLSSTMAAILAVTDGDLKVTIDAVAYNLTGITFAGAETWADVATILQRRLQNGIVEATVNGIKITSKKVGTASTVTIAAVAGGGGTDLAAVGYFKAATSVAVAGANSSGETILEAITRSKDLVSYAAVMTDLQVEDAVILNTANAIQAMDMMFLHQVASSADIAGIVTSVKNAGDTKTRLLLYTPSLTAGNLMKAAYAGNGFSVNYNGSDTARTMNLKQLVTIEPDLGITQTMYDAANIAGCDLYVSYQGVPGVYSTGGNDYFDNPYMDLALKFALESAGFNFLRQTNTKVPQTEQGMNGLKNAYAQVLQRFVTNGCIAPGSWTSPETFGNPDVMRQNILEVGYYIYSQPVVLQSAEEREERKAPLVQIALKRAGAIQTSDVIVLVND